MEYDFDTLLDRRGTKSTKWDYIADRFGTDDVLPFSLADADFPVFPGILEAIESRMKVQNFGYSRWNDEGYFNAICNWYKNDSKCDSRDINPDWIVYGPSVIYFVSALIKKFSCPGDTVVTFNPMYDSFFRVIQKNNRVLRKVDIKGPDGGYSFSFDDIERELKQKEAKIFLLTNPHNPTGYMFSEAEISRLYKICRKNDVFLISDDIHQGINHGEKLYYPVTNLIDGEWEEEPTLALLNSTSKTFNTAGLGGSFAFLPCKKLKEDYLVRTKDMDAVNSASCFSVEAAIAGFNDGLEYVEQMREYIHSNFLITANYFEENNIAIKCGIPDATYVAWLNAEGLGMTEDEIQDKLINKGKVGILRGSLFGDERYLRMNIGCPKNMLQDGLNRIKMALS